MAHACKHDLQSSEGRGLRAQLCLKNSSPDIYDYDGPSLVDLLWNINKLNRLQIIVTTEFKPQTVVLGNGCLSLSVPLYFSLSFSSRSDSMEPECSSEHNSTIDLVGLWALMGRAVTLRVNQRKEVRDCRMLLAEIHHRPVQPPDFRSCSLPGGWGWRWGG